MKTFAYYYEQIENTKHPNDDVSALINLHKESFERFGWEVLRVGEDTARQHPKFELFDNPGTVLGKSGNPWVYTRACYMRWLAYSVAGCYFADFDVMNYGFLPSDAQEIVAMCEVGRPIFLSPAGAVGLMNKPAYEKVIQTYVDFIERPVIEGAMSQDVNDMTIMRQLRPEWYESISYFDDRYCKDYTNPGWETANLVHYPYFFTKSPRAEVVKEARSA